MRIALRIAHATKFREQRRPRESKNHGKEGRGKPEFSGSQKKGGRGGGEEGKRGKRGDGLKGKEGGKMREKGWEERGPKTHYVILVPL